MLRNNEILECNDIEKLKKLAIGQNKALSYIATTIGDVIDYKLSQHEGLEDMKDYYYKHYEEFFVIPGDNQCQRD